MTGEQRGHCSEKRDQWGGEREMERRFFNRTNAHGPLELWVGRKWLGFTHLAHTAVPIACACEVSKLGPPKSLIVGTDCQPFVS